MNKRSQEDENQLLLDNMKGIKQKIIVMSGKGGVGKSTVAANLAAALAESGKKTGLLDIDIHGPSIPSMLNLSEERLTADSANPEKLSPVKYNDNLHVISIGFLIENDGDPVIWKGPLKYSAIKQFLSEVHWGHLDYLIIDSPPGTGDEPLTVCQLLPKPAGAVIVTTPQDVALLDVKKSINFCKKIEMPVYGIVENMSGLICPSCRVKINLFKTGGGKKLADEMNVPFLGEIPIEPEIVASGDSGRPFCLQGTSNAANNSIKNIVTSILKI